MYPPWTDEREQSVKNQPMSELSQCIPGEPSRLASAWNSHFSCGLVWSSDQRRSHQNYITWATTVRHTVLCCSYFRIQTKFSSYRGGAISNHPSGRPNTLRKLVFKDIRNMTDCTREEKWRNCVRWYLLIRRPLWNIIYKISTIEVTVKSYYHWVDSKFFLLHQCGARWENHLIAFPREKRVISLPQCWQTWSSVPRWLFQTSVQPL